MHHLLNDGMIPVKPDGKAMLWVEHSRYQQPGYLQFAYQNEPLFPPTLVGLGNSGGFAAVGLRRDGWHGAGPIRDIFRNAFEAAGLPYFNPHSFRNTLVQLGERLCTTAEEFKAWSQNLGHDRVMTTLTSYGTVAPHRQADLIRGLMAAKQGGIGKKVTGFFKKLFGGKES